MLQCTQNGKTDRTMSPSCQTRSASSGISISSTDDASVRQCRNGGRDAQICTKLIDRAAVWFKPIQNSSFPTKMVKISRLRSELTAFHGVLTIASGLLWVALWLFNKEITSFSHVTGGINLIYLPAGFRLLIVLTFGFWGALGIFIADPILFLLEFGSGNPLEVLAAAAISGFVPWLAVLLFVRVARIQYSLVELKPLHLPLLALAVSAVTPLFFNIEFAIAGMHGAGEFLRNYSAMATGDFLGCLIVIAFVRLAVGTARYLFE